MDTTIKKPDKKSLLYLGIVLIIAVLVGIGYFYYLSKTEIKAPEELSEKLEQEKVIKKQPQELEESKEEVPPLTEKEIQKQLKELEKLR